MIEARAAKAPDRGATISGTSIAAARGVQHRHFVRVATLAAEFCPFCPAAPDREHCPRQGELVAPGTTIATTRSDADCAWLLRTGLVLVTEPMTGECSIATPGALIGLDCLLSERRLCNAVAILPTTLCALPREVLVSFLVENPDQLRTIVDAAVEDPAVSRRLDHL